MCRQAKGEDNTDKSAQDTQYIEQEEAESQQEPSNTDLNLFVVKLLQGGNDQGIYVDLKINHAPLCMELDTGADIT